MLCEVCGPPDAPRPTGVATFTYNGVTHRTGECAALSSVGEVVVRSSGGYVSKSGRKVCMECFGRGLQHSYPAGEDPHDRFDPRRRHDRGERIRL